MQCIGGVHEKTEKLSELIDGYIPNDELKYYMCEILKDILSYVKEAYNPELINLKLQLEHLQQELILMKVNVKNAEGDLYFKHLQIRQRIFEIENPF